MLFRHTSWIFQRKMLDVKNGKEVVSVKNDKD